MAQVVRRENLVQKAHLDHQDQEQCQDHQENLGQLALLDLPDHLVLTGSQE